MSLLYNLFPEEDLGPAKGQVKRWVVGNMRAWLLWAKERPVCDRSVGWMMVLVTGEMPNDGVCSGWERMRIVN